MPKVSIVMATSDNHYMWVDSAVESILEQSFYNFEFIIINDSPSNKDFEEKMQNLISIDSRIKYFRNKTNIGFASSINKAIKIANGEYIVRMDSDDISYKDRIDNQIKFMDKFKHIGISGMQADIINEKGCIIGSFDKPTNEYIIKQYIYHQNPLIHPTYIVRKKVYEDLNFYRNFSPGQDYDFLARAYLKKIKIGNSSKKGLKWRAVKSSISHNHKKSYSKFFITCKVRNMLKKGKIFNKNLIKGKNNKNLFELIYKYRLNFIYFAKKSNLFFKFIYLFLACFLSFFHPLLADDLLHSFIAKIFLKLDKFL